MTTETPIAEVVTTTEPATVTPVEDKKTTETPATGETNVKPNRGGSREGAGRKAGDKNDKDKTEPAKTEEKPPNRFDKFNRANRENREKVGTAEMLKKLEEEKKLSPGEKKKVEDSWQAAGSFLLQSMDMFQSRFFSAMSGKDTKEFLFTEDEKKTLKIPIEGLMSSMAESTQKQFSPGWGLLFACLMVFSPRIIELGQLKGWFDSAKKKKEKAEREKQKQEMESMKERIDEMEREKQEFIRAEKDRLANRQAFINAEIQKQNEQKEKEQTNGHAKETKFVDAVTGNELKPEPVTNDQQ